MMGRRPQTTHKYYVKEYRPEWNTWCDCEIFYSEKEYTTRDFRRNIDGIANDQMERLGKWYDDSDFFLMEAFPDGFGGEEYVRR